MILKPVLKGATAAGAVTAASGVVVVAVSFAFYALFKYLFAFTGELAPAIASALVAVLVAGAAAIGAALATRSASPKPKPKDELKSPLDRALDLAKERPVVAAAGALAAGLLALRNPALVAAAFGAFSQPPPRSKK